MTSAAPIDPPAPAEYAEYWTGYVARASGSNPLEQMERQLDELLAALQDFDDVRASTRPTPTEWSIKEVVGHLIDTERVFAYRALRIARGDKTPLPGFEQDDYVAHGTANAFPLADLLTEFELVRRSTILLFRHLDPAAFNRRGTCSGGPMSVRAMAFIIPGHVWTHLDWLYRDYPELDHRA